MLAHEDNDTNERTVYYLSKRFHDYETRYTRIEKSCFTLVCVVQKLRHIILPSQIWIVARMDPLKYLFEKHALSGRISRFCAENPIERDDGKEDFPNEDILDIELGAWKMYFDGAVNQYGNGIGYF